MTSQLTLPGAPKALFHAEISGHETWQKLTTSVERLHDKSLNPRSITHQRESALQALHGADAEFDAALATNPRLMRRLVLTLWAEDSGLASTTMTPRRVSSLVGNVTLTPLQTRSLANVYLNHFDTLRTGRKSMFKAVAAALRTQLHAMTPGRAQHSLLGALRAHSELAVGTKGPETLSMAAAKDGMTLDEALRSRGLEGIRGTEFGSAVMRAHYLRRLGKADPTQHHGFLEELREEGGLRSLTDDGRLFGHHVIEVMSSTDREPCEQWIGTVLHFAGDPRVTRGEHWATWWKHVASTARDRVLSWLVKKDLEFFLQAFEQFSKDHIPQFAHQFVQRRDFILGLLGQGVIRQTRLFVGEIAMTQLRSDFGSDMTQGVAQIEGHRGQTGGSAIIAMDCGDFQLVEGSHNHQLWVYVSQRPDGLFERIEDLVPMSFIKKYTTKDDQPTNKGRSRYRGFPHQGSVWQMKAVEYLKEYGHTLPLSKLMSPENYGELRRIHGVPSHLG